VLAKVCSVRQTDFLKMPKFKIKPSKTKPQLQLHIFLFIVLSKIANGVCCCGWYELNSKAEVKKMI